MNQYRQHSLSISLNFFKLSFSGFFFATRAFHFFFFLSFCFDFLHQTQGRFLYMICSNLLNLEFLCMSYSFWITVLFLFSLPLRIPYKVPNDFIDINSFFCLNQIYFLIFYYLCTFFFTITFSIVLCVTKHINLRQTLC